MSKDNPHNDFGAMQVITASRRLRAACRETVQFSRHVQSEALRLRQQSKQLEIDCQQQLSIFHYEREQRTRQSG